MDKKQLIECIERLKEGDESQFEKVYLATNNRLYNYIFSLSDSLNNDDCYEIVQETYIQVCRKIDTLKDSSKFMSWLFMIGRNKALRYLDKRKNEVLTSEDGAGILEQEKETEYVPEEILDSREKKKMILDIIEALPKDQKEAIYLRYYKGLSIKEISEKMGIKEGTVKSNLNYGRKKIKGEVELLEKKGTKLYGISSLPLLLLLLREAYNVQAMEGKVGEEIYSNVVDGFKNLGESAGQAIENGVKNSSNDVLTGGEKLSASEGDINISSSTEGMSSNKIKGLRNASGRSALNGATITGISAIVTLVVAVGGYAYFSGSEGNTSLNEGNNTIIEGSSEEDTNVEEGTITENDISFTSYKIEVESMYKVIKNNNIYGFESELDEFDKIINEELELIDDGIGDRYYDWVWPSWLNDFIGWYILDVDNVIYFKEQVNKISKLNSENREIVEKCDDMINYFLNNQEKINKIAEKMSVIANYGDGSRGVEAANDFMEDFHKYSEKVEYLRSLM